MNEDQYNEIINRLTKIENYLKPLEEDTSYHKKILSTIIGNLIWEWLNYGTQGTIIHPPKF